MMQSNTEGPVELELELASGTLRAHRWGEPGGPLVLCVHGLSANSRSFDFLAPRLARGGRTVVAIDLRGRGKSAITARGTYGWNGHAKDALEAASALGSERFSYVGHSMGAFVGMEVARRAPNRLRHLVLIDAAGTPEAAALPPIMTAVQRLGATYASADEYLARVRSIGTVPWNDVWETHYRYDLVATQQGVRSRTDADAVLEDVAYGMRQTPSSFWPALAMRALLVRASRPLGGGFIVAARDRDAFVAAAPRATAVDVDDNHYGIMTHADTASEIGRFLG